MHETRKQKSLNQIKEEAAEVAADIEALRNDLIDLSTQIRSFYEQVQAANIPRLALALNDAESRISAAVDATDEALSAIPVEGKENSSNV